jgi:hypothetical protein
MHGLPDVICVALILLLFGACALLVQFCAALMDRGGRP